MLLQNDDVLLAPSMQRAEELSNEGYLVSLEEFQKAEAAGGLTALLLEGKDFFLNFGRITGYGIALASMV